jgi:hypothetical protein
MNCVCILYSSGYRLCNIKTSTETLTEQQNELCLYSIQQWLQTL